MEYLLPTSQLSNLPPCAAGLGALLLDTVDSSNDTFDLILSLYYKFKYFKITACCRFRFLELLS